MRRLSSGYPVVRKEVHENVRRQSVGTADT